MILLLAYEACLLKRAISAMISKMPISEAIIDGPVGLSSPTEIMSPINEAGSANPQPSAKRQPLDCVTRSALTGGITNNANTSKTPAICTDDVTTMPKLA